MWNYQPYYQQQKTEVTRVNGEGGASAYQLPPNSSALLLDTTAPIVWLKTTDGAGYPSLTPYSITPYKPVNTLEERITKLEEMINAKSNTTNAKRRNEAQSADDSAS